MSSSQYAGSIQQIRVRTVRRPPGVVLVALFQAFKAAVLLATAFFLHFRPGERISSQSLLYPLLYVATRGNTAFVNTAMSGSKLLPALVLAFGIYLAYLASGLWQMQQFARRSVMLTSGITLLLYLKSAFWSGDRSMTEMSFFSPSLHNVHILLFVDTAIFVYLMRGATARHFELAP